MKRKPHPAWLPKPEEKWEESPQEFQHVGPTPLGMAAGLCPDCGCPVYWQFPLKFVRVNGFLRVQHTECGLNGQKTNEADDAQGQDGLHDGRGGQGQG